MDLLGKQMPEEGSRASLGGPFRRRQFRWSFLVFFLWLIIKILVAMRPGQGVGATQLSRTLCSVEAIAS